MYYSITFESLADGEKRNTWEDWHLIPSSPPMVKNPEVYKNYVEIPGRIDGPLDLSEVLTEGPVFLNVEGSWELIWSQEYCPYLTRAEAFDVVTKFLHGKRFRIVLEENPDNAYIGRIEVGELKPGNAYSAIPINYTINPTNSNPIDVNEENYQSTTGGIPWYSGDISGYNSGSGSSSGSGSGSGSGSSISEQYKSGWNDAIDAASSFTGYTGDYARYIYGFNGQTNGGTTVLTGNIRARLVYSLPTRKSGTLTDYGKGYNAAIDAFSDAQQYYVGTYYGGTNNAMGEPFVAVSGSKTGYNRPSKK